MTKRILVLLDPEAGSQTLSEFAIDIAKRNDASLSGLCVVNTSEINREVSGGGIGAMYYAEKLRRDLTDEARSEAQKSLSEFVAEIEAAGIPHEDDNIGEGPIVGTLIRELRTHDLLISSSVSHTKDSDSKRRSDAFARVLREGVAAVLLVGRESRPIKKATVAVGERSTSARVVQRFVHLSPFGTDISVDLVNIRGDSDVDKLESEVLLSGVKGYFNAHGYSNVVTSSVPMGDSIASRILGHVDSSESDLLVSGAYSRTGWKKLLLGTATTEILEGVKVSLFMAH